MVERKNEREEFFKSKDILPIEFKENCSVQFLGCTNTGKSTMYLFHFGGQETKSATSCCNAKQEFETESGDNVKARIWDTVSHDKKDSESSNYDKGVKNAK